MDGIPVAQMNRTRYDVLRHSRTETPVAPVAATRLTAHSALSAVNILFT
jgi:hypothetical protein